METRSRNEDDKLSTEPGQLQNPSTGQKAAMHHVREVGSDLVRSREFVIAGIRPGHIEGILSSWHRTDPIEADG